MTDYYHCRVGGDTRVTPSAGKKSGDKKWKVHDQAGLAD